MREVCFLLDAAGMVLWQDTTGSAGALADSRSRWEAIWARRDALAEVAHTHPGGLLAFSAEDLTTMDAIDAALGRPLAYSVVTAESVLRREPSGVTLVAAREPAWVSALRTASGLEGTDGDSEHHVRRTVGGSEATAR
jgi:hypothetical protein